MKKLMLSGLLVMIVIVALGRIGYEYQDSVQKQRIAVLPIKVWEQLVDDAAYQCWILPGDRYTADTTYAIGDWVRVESKRCKGIAQVRPSR